MAISILLDDDLLAQYARTSTKTIRAAEAAINRGIDDCDPWPYCKDRYGYGKMHFTGKSGDTYKSGPIRAHRYVCERVNGPPPNPTDSAAHSCHNPSCINPRHLSWKSHTENMGEMAAAGRSTAGERNHHAKLTAETVAAIRRDLEKDQVTVVAKRYGISRAQASRIKRRQSWRFI